jgi:NAD(P)-dependent dehydrogenase (short-subunit alcohol dehydrogenase family)
MSTLHKFRLDGRVAVITGGGGLMGVQHAQAIAEAGGVPVLWDIQTQAAEDAAAAIRAAYGVDCRAAAGVDITAPEAVRAGLNEALARYGRVDILINNAANDPKVGPEVNPAWSRLENFSLEMWLNDISVGLTGAFLCSREVGAHMAARGGGVILNIASDLGVIAPDQRIYRKDGLADNQQPVKPVTYSVIKHGLIGLTKYLATYWAEAKIRVNALSPGGIFTSQPPEFVAKLTGLIPLGRMAELEEYRAAVLFLVSDASSYMTGANLIVDGGRTTW